MEPYQTLTDLEKWQAHVDLCPACQASEVGLCRRGQDLLGIAAKMRPRPEDEAQQELPLDLGRPEVQNRPLVRAALREFDRQMANAAAKS